MAAPSGIDARCAEADSEPVYIRADELALELGRPDLQIVDVRDDDFAGGHIPGARHCPSARFQTGVDYLAQEFAGSGAILVFHCMFSASRGPGCARLFLRHLEARYPERTCKVCILQGGFIGWERRFGGAPDVAKYIEDRLEEPEFGPKNFYTMPAQEDPQ